MRRLLAILALLAVLAAAALTTGAGGDSSEGDDYLVRAIFDNAGFLIDGEDVKAAGVKIGTVKSLDTTADAKAVVVLKITDPGYQDFRADANCIVRPQSLIGEKFVECSPTRKRDGATAEAPPLKRIERGEGKGQHLLPIENTSKSVDLDLLNNVMRLPYRQRFSVILNELGTGVAGRGDDLREVIRRADPALEEIDEVLETLGRQNETLVRLAEDSDRALAPLARDRRSVTGFISRSEEVARATAERREDLEADLERLPRFLDELTPTMQRLGGLSEQATPALADLGENADDVNRLVSELGPFSAAATPALRTLGEAARVGRPALVESRPLVRDLRGFARQARPVGASLSDVLTSLRRTGGIERLMDLIFYGTTSINGYDSLGHYLRAALLVNTCSAYTTTAIEGCSANFTRGSASDASAAAAGEDDPVLRRTRRALAGEPAAKILAEDPPAADSAAAAPTATPAPAPVRTKAKSEPKAETAPPPAAGTGAGTPDATDEGLLDYLFGQGAG